MEQVALKVRILNYIKKQNGFVNGGEIERLAMSAGFKASNASRRLRELREEGLLEKEERRGKKRKSVWYKYKSQEVTYTRQLELR
jgi:DNA-binding IclR family transcriptional regulator